MFIRRANLFKRLIRLHETCQNVYRPCQNGYKTFIFSNYTTSFKFLVSASSPVSACIHYIYSNCVDQFVFGEIEKSTINIQSQVWHSVHLLLLCFDLQYYWTKTRHKATRVLDAAPSNHLSRDWLPQGRNLKPKRIISVEDTAR